MRSARYFFYIQLSNSRGVLGLIDNDIITVEELKKLIETKSDDVSIIMTGCKIDDSMCEVADEISQVEPMNYKVYNIK